MVFLQSGLQAVKLKRRLFSEPNNGEVRAQPLAIAFVSAADRFAISFRRQPLHFRNQLLSVTSEATVKLALSVTADVTVKSALSVTMELQLNQPPSVTSAVTVKSAAVCYL